MSAVAKKFEIDLDAPLKSLPPKSLDILFGGTGDEKLEIVYTHPCGRSVTYRQRFSGIMATLQHYYDETSSEGIRKWIESYMNTTRCAVCGGGRLRKESLAVKLTDSKTKKSCNIHAVVTLSLRKALGFFSSLSFTNRQLKSLIRF